MNEAASQARGSDIGSLLLKGVLYINHHFGDWLKEKFPDYELVDPMAKKNVARGPRHPITLMMLLPPRFIDELLGDYKGYDFERLRIHCSDC